MQVERAKLDGDSASWLKLAAQWQRMRRKRIPLANKHSNLEQKSGPEKGTIRFVANFARKFSALLREWRMACFAMSARPRVT